ncbi:MAG TPA: RNase J family beta-CASP ribonuclease [Candidatus Paceibacterota bacterium]|nr:RNase J family beta-CASP ribonuclease [Candidatus Paceibacterota bacterium]
MKVYTIGGFNEVGKNMTVVDVGDDAFIFDMGLFLPPIVELEEAERNQPINEKKLRRLKAIPDDLILDRLGLRKKIRAIFLGHAHLDHIGAVPYIAQRYNAEIIGTPFTIEVLKTILRDEAIKIRNRIKVVQPNSSYTIQGKNNKKYVVDFINITHSTPQTSMICLHTPQGNVLYANDFKFDNHPVLGKKPNYEKLREVAKEGIKVLIVDSLYSGTERKTPSEQIARGLLEDVMLTTDNKNSAIFVTTFSSHIARLKSIVDFGKKLNRKIVFVGRSLNKYVSAAIKTKICPFSKDIELTSYRRQKERALKQIDKNRTKYLVVCTGHQGEPGSVLDRLSKNQLPFSFRNQDHLIFSSSVIPTPINISNRQQLESRFKKRGIRIFSDVHVSGHAGREDLRDFITLVHPEHIIPAHGNAEKLAPMAELASEMGYTVGKNVHVMRDTQSIELK